MLTEIIENILQDTPGNRAKAARHIRLAVIEQNKLEEMADIILTESSLGIKEELPLINICKSIITSLCRMLDVSPTVYTEGERHRAGIRYIDYLHGHVKPVVKEAVRRDGSVDYQTLLVSSSSEMANVVKEVNVDKFQLDPTLGPTQWRGFTMRVGEHRVLDLVKKARRYNMQSHYSYDEIPEVYDAINRLQAVPFTINEWVLELAQTNFGFIPSVVESKDKSKAVRAIAQMKMKARKTNSVEKLEESDWYADQHEVVSDWSQRLAFERCVEKGHQWKGKACYFTYTLDTRSRMYAVQPFTNPQGSDFAKSALMYYNAQPLNPQTFAVVTANHAGADKLSFQDRVKWVEDRIDEIIDIGADPIGNYHILKEWEIDKEDKSRWQFVACCREWYNIWKWQEAGNPMETYQTRLVAALDATCSALQIATVISRDEKMAEHVNLIRQDKPGDIYKVSGEELLVKMRKLKQEDITPGLQLVLDHESIRKVAKRPQMVADYSGTLRGMQTMTYTDRKKNKIEPISKKDANVIGKLLYEVTNDDARGSTKIKNFLRSGVKFHNGGAMMQWKTIDNFTCFQVADRSEEGTAQGTISGVDVNLKFYVFKNVPNKQKHQNLLCPNITHSADASIVRYITNRMPEHSPLAMVHDSYGTSTADAHHLLPLVLEAFQLIGDREWYEDMVAEMINYHRPLPSAGKLTLEQIAEANYAIC